MNIIAKNLRGGGKNLSYLLAAFFAFATAQFAQAANCYWAGGTSSDWGTVANWTTGNKVPNNDGAYFRSDKFNNNFKSGNRAYLVTLNAAHTNNWRTFFCKCGTASAPIILRANNATSGLTSGDTTETDRKKAEGIYIGTAYNGGDTGSKDNNASEGDAYVRFETGTFASGANHSYWFLGHGTYHGHMTVAGATINSPLEFYLNRGSLTVDSGTVNITKDVKMGTNGDAMLTMNGGTLTVGPWTRFENSSYAKTINLNGGTLVTYRINKQGGAGAATVNFNGGTLRIKTNYNSVIDSGVTVNVKANGGTIDVNGSTTAAIPASFSEDSSSPGGGMKFCGGGTLTLGGSIGYTGGTTIEAGTTLNVATVAQKDALLGSGLNTLKVIPSSTGTFTLITITGDGEFSETDKLKVAIVDGYNTDAVFSLSDDEKSLKVTVRNMYSGGAINQDTPTLVFPGATLADLATHTLRARMQGGHVDDDGAEVTFFNRVELKGENDVLTNVTYQLQVLDGSYVKCVYVNFTEDANGVYAKLADGNYGTYGGSLNTFGTEPITSNADSGRQYYPYDFRLVPAANAISVNFNHGDGNMFTTSSSRVGAGDYAVPYTSWNNMSVSQGSSKTFGGATFTQTKTSGQFKCTDLNKQKDLCYGYLDDGGGTVVIDVTDIPYEFYRIVTYHATDNADVQFGYVKINDTRYMGVTDATVKGNSSWGASGARNKAKSLREGVNYLVSDVMSGSSATITGHKASPARGCIAAVQVVEYALSTYTATIDDGGAKVLSGLSWDNSLPALLTAKDRVVLNVNKDTTLDVDIPVDVFGITFNVAEGKTLTLSGQNILSQYITATGAGQTVVANSSQLAGTVKGDGTIVYDGVRPTTTGTDIIFTNPLWTGTLVIKGFNKDNSATGANRKLFANLWGNVNSKIKWNGVSGYFEGCTSTAGWILEDLEADSVIYPALTKNDGSSNKLTTAPSIEGSGTFADASEPTERFKFANADDFTGTIRITASTAEKGMNVQFGASGVAVVPGAIHILSQAAVTVSAGKTWTAVGGLVLNGTLNLDAGASVPKIVGGAGSIAVTSGTVIVNGVGASAQPGFHTAQESTLKIVDDALTAMTLSALDNQGVLDLRETALTEFILNLPSDVTIPTLGEILFPEGFEKFVVSPVDQTIRSLANYTKPQLPEGIEYYVILAETREEFGKGSMIVTNCAAGVNVRVVRLDGTQLDMVPAEGTVMLTGAPQIAGMATAFDFTFTNTVDCAYQSPGLNIGSNWDNSGSTPMTYNNENKDSTTGARIKHHPWVTGAGNLIYDLENFTIVLVGTMSPSRNTQFFHMGTTSTGSTGLLITTTENDNEVLIAKNTGSTVDAAGGVRAAVPNAATARHAYIIKKRGTVFEVWVDGVKRGQFDAGEGFTLSAGGMQVGSDHGGYIRNAGIYKDVPNNDGETGYVNVLRMFDYALSDEQAEAVFNEYPYVSQGGLYTRTVAADGTFSQTGAWEKEGASGTFAVPEGARVNETYYNPSATIEVDADAEIEVNADVALETLTVGGKAALAFAADGAHAVTVAGAAIINSPITIEYGALNISSAPVQLGSSGAIHFDLSGMDTSGLYTEGYVQLTGLMEPNDDKVTATLPTDPDRTFKLAYNTSASCYGLNVTPKHNYVVVENVVTTSPTLTADKANIIVGAGGLNIETLSIPESATVVYDPIKTPLYVWGTAAGSFSIGEGVKFKLTPNYAGMTLGRVILFAYKEEYVTGLPENLNTLLDATSIAPNAAYTITSEDVPDASPYRKQLVLTVGDYENDAKEIVVMAAGDSITQGVANSAQGGADPQYRTSIAAYLAANGYRPKFRGVWRYSDRNGANVKVPDDWAWHSGFGCAAIRTTASSGGLADNMPFYLDIAGYPDVITLLIGTNDLGMNGKEAADVFATYVQLVNDTAAQRPAAKIIGATLLPRPGEAGEKVVTFNELLAAEYAKSGKGDLPDNFHLLDLHPLVPNDIATSDVTGNYAADNLHPNWKGHAIIAEAFYEKIAELLPLAEFEGAGDNTITDAEQTALGAANIADLAAYRSGMTHVYTIEKNGAAGANNCFTSVPYTAVEYSAASTRNVTKVGYFMELVRKGTNRRRWVWVDMDATGKTLGEVEFPWDNPSMQRIATKLHVKSNYAGIHDVAPDNDSVSGIVEGTKWNYSTTAAIGDAPDDIFGSNAYGWNDTMGTDGGHGCFQVHRIFSQEAGDTHWNDAEVLFAWNSWGSKQANAEDTIGIGPYFCHVEAANKKVADYTQGTTSTGNQEANVSSAAYSVRRLEIWAALEDFTPQHGLWIGAGLDGDFDNAANWEDGCVPAVGENIDFSATAPNTTISVTGASAGRKFGTATMGASVVTFTGDIAFAGITDTSKIAVGSNSTVSLDGDLEFSGNGDQYVVNTVAASGRFVVTGDIVATEDFTGDNIWFAKSLGGGCVVAKGLVCNATGSESWPFRLAPNVNGTANWIVGPNGISGTKKFYLNANANRGGVVRPNDSDFTISTTIGVRAPFTLNTTGADGNGHKITIASPFDMDGYGSATTIAGTGTVLVNAVNTYQGNVNVTDTATLAINPGKKMTTGAITVNSGATLQVAESGTNTVNNLTLADGAILGFNFTQRKVAPVLEVSGTVMANGTIKVKVGGEQPAFLNGGKHVLTSGGKFTGATVARADGTPSWVNSVSVDENDNIVADIKPMGTLIFVR